MQAAHPVHRPEVTTSVNSSAQCGFSGGMALPYRGPGAPTDRRRREATVDARVGTLGRVPELPEVEPTAGWPTGPRAHRRLGGDSRRLVHQGRGRRAGAPSAPWSATG